MSAASRSERWDIGFPSIQALSPRTDSTLPWIIGNPCPLQTSTKSSPPAVWQFSSASSSFPLESATNCSSDTASGESFLRCRSRWFSDSKWFILSCIALDCSITWFSKPLSLWLECDAVAVTASCDPASLTVRSSVSSNTRGLTGLGVCVICSPAVVSLMPCAAPLARRNTPPTAPVTTAPAACPTS